MADERKEQFAQLQAKKAESHFTPGSLDDRDPDYLWIETTVEQVEEWFAAVRANAGGKRRVRLRRTAAALTVVPLFSEWQLKALASFEQQVEEAREVGRAKPLSGRQLVVLKAMINTIAAATADVLVCDGETP